MVSRRQKLILILTIGVVVCGGLAGVSLAYSPSLTVVHEYEDHSQTLADVAYAEQFDIVFSLDEEGGFYAYQIQRDRVDQINEFEAGHALTVGEGVVYIAAADTLWAFDVEAGELTELTQLEAHPPAIAYDEARDVVWTVGNGTVYGYDATDGSEYMTYTAHTGGIETIAVRGDYIATGTTWSDEVVVYNVESEEVAFEPDLPDDVGQVGAVHITAGDELIVGTGAEEGDVVAMFDIVQEEQIISYREHIFSVSAVEYDQEHDVIISMGFDNTIKFYDVEAGEVATVYEHPDTIYTGDLDTRNDLLWVGDGEERSGTVTGIDVFYQEPTPTQTPTPTESETPSPTPDMTPSATPETTPDETNDQTEDETPTTPGDDGAGFGPVLAFLVFVGLALLAARTR